MVPAAATTSAFKVKATNLELSLSCSSISLSSTMLESDEETKSEDPPLNQILEVTNSLPLN